MAGQRSHTAPATLRSQPPTTGNGTPARHSQPIRVLHCLWHGENGGAERSVYQLARAQMRDPGISPGLLYAQGRGPYWEAAQELGCPVVSLDIPNGRSIRYVRRVAEVMRDYSIHHFH